MGVGIVFDPNGYGVLSVNDGFSTDDFDSM
jgi:hypothetical protein